MMALVVSVPTILTTMAVVAVTPVVPVGLRSARFLSVVVSTTSLGVIVEAVALVGIMVLSVIGP